MPFTQLGEAIKKFKAQATPKTFHPLPATHWHITKDEAHHRIVRKACVSKCEEFLPKL